MKTTIALFALLLAACTPSKSASPDAGTPDGGPAPIKCGSKTCAPGQSCLALDSSPGVPACVDPGDCHAVPLGKDLVGQMLKAAGYTRCTLKFPDNYLAQFPQALQHDPWRLPHFDRIHNDPLLAPGWADALTAAMGDPARTRAASEDIAEAAKRLGYPIKTTRPSYPVDPDHPLAKAIANLDASLGGTADEASLETQAAGIPLSLRKKVAQIIEAESNALGWRNQAFANVADLPALYRYAAAFYLQSGDGRALDPNQSAVREMLTTGIDWTALYQGAYDLAATVEDVGLESEAGELGFSFQADTPLGKVIVGDAKAETYPALLDPVLLLVDTGGDDTYHFAAGANTSVDAPISVVVDLGGNDTYAYDVVPNPNDTGRLPSDIDGRFNPRDPSQGETAMSKSDRPRQGAGRCGYGMLFDFGGNDHYQSLRMSQGFGAFGVGVLEDRAGDDTYEAEAGAQGAADFGIGLLLDASGNDQHKIYAFGQGFAYVRGFGALIDGGGDDLYYANPGDPSEGGDPLYYTPQLPGNGNASFVQGSAFGRRDDTYVAPMSGGIGLLADLGSGKDHYVASVFGQGTGYMFGTGVLEDMGGDDQYEGKWYVQGSDAHFALAVFHDHGGNDQYNNQNVAPTATSMGVGHDYSVGWFLDDGGDDVYHAPGLSLGSGNAQGFGFFIDGGGNDQYTANGGPTMGDYGDPAGDSTRAAEPTLGFLLDRGGQNTWKVGSESRSLDGKTTTAPPDASSPPAKGVLLQASQGDILFLP